jgi:hypothetical protein
MCKAELSPAVGGELISPAVHLNVEGGALRAGGP